MHTRSRRAWFKNIGRLAVALWPLAAVAAVLAAITAADAPPGAPGFAADNAADPTAGVFLFNPAAKTGTVRFNAVAPRAGETIGYRLYVGNQARAAGSPYALGNTPCDLGAATTASLHTCIDPNLLAAQNVHVSVTAYNQFGNEGNYATDAIFVPVTSPVVTSTSSAGGNNGSAKSITLNWTRGTAPGGVTVQTEIFRRRLDSSGTPISGYTKLTVPSNAVTLTDNAPELDKDTRYEYTLRSVANPGGGTVTYSTPNVVTIVRTPKDVYNVTVQGSNIGSNPVGVAGLTAGDSVVVSDVSGTVNFNTSGPCVQSAYIVGPGGLARATYESDGNLPCYSGDRACADPVGAGPHAALYLRRNSSPTFVGTGGASFSVNGAENLSFFVNDCGNTPNSGSFGCRVTVSRP
jgi:hypothetical protein